MTEPLTHLSPDQDSEPSQPVQNSNNEAEIVAATKESEEISSQPTPDKEEKSERELPITLKERDEGM